MQFKIDISEFRLAHGRKPRYVRGVGYWYFRLEGKDLSKEQREFSFKGPWVLAIQVLKGRMAELGSFTASVLP